MGHLAIITGASSGIGAALAEELAAQGYAVGLIARRAEALDAVAERVRATGGVVATATADVSDAEALQAAITVLEGALGPCEVLVANAGVALLTPMDPLELARHRSVLATNLYGAIHAFGAVVPGMVARRRGVVVAVSSLASYRGLPGQAAYCASKAALSAFVTCMRQDLRGSGVRVLDVCPGFVDTPMSGKASFQKPGMVSAADAARRIRLAIQRRRSFLAFPWLTAKGMLLLRLLPARWADALMLRFMGPRRPQAG